MKKNRRGRPIWMRQGCGSRPLGTKLRQMFDAVVNEPVPDDFLEILRRADDEKPEDER